MVHRTPAMTNAAFQAPFVPFGDSQNAVLPIAPIAVHYSFRNRHSFVASDCWCLQRDPRSLSSRGRCGIRRRAHRSTLLRNKKTSKEQDEEDENSEEKAAIGDVSHGQDEKDREFLKRELARVESLEDILDELEAYGEEEFDHDDEEYFFEEWDDETLDELFQSLPDEDEDYGDEETYLDLDDKRQSTSLLENALLQGVVPVGADVGSDCLPGDYGFDPLSLAEKDYFRQAQAFLLNMIPRKENKYLELEEEATNKSVPEISNEGNEGARPQALILRDYREAEIRHGRLAMLAASFWPLQELLDRLVLEDDQFDSLLHSLFFGGVTLPYFPLLMTGIMLLLGYLDIYSQAIKDMDKIGEAFLPGDCFWDPLQILTGAPDRMKRNMQERELFNGRFAMLAFAVYIWEEATTGLPLVSVEGNELLFEPAYTVPFIQEWLDDRFSTASPVFYRFPDNELFDTITSLDLILASHCDSLQTLI